ncbi:Bifunctional NAD(P)H-hydrate repair enzyme Nnr [Frankia canadensis]|uniref:Bifunctional NAD(P)H-hydrate repair enzyme n=1 Tax=Frankia canadensis TaxID=1836972 RepID=A0A2I2KU19_9ACTN|nr:NAD(P)H-hydrate dehydratase [Frankia canadensis]SNQ49155.1 Bifunctional NAD(P)H-hydrate repair enzyme Nnr [Frankia canadensis]SOU56445.1 Bifunctional NAD(P)H-hydrate repair enzyme Nnr [Frankia canadensis]
MPNAHTVDQVRAAEAPLLAGPPPGILMQRAVSGLVAYVARRLGRVHGARIVVLAGGGDNGGDALWAGARLAARGARVDALAPGRTHPEGSAALLAAGGRLHGPDPAPADEVARALVGEADLVLDGLLGIGGRGGLRPAHARLAAFAPPRRTVAVDVPSGVDADTGEVAGEAVRASATVTFGTHKRGLWLMPGAAHTGPVELVDIGLVLPEPDLRALDDADVAALLPVPGAASSKYRRGVLGLVAGSDAYPGAAVLAVGGALRGGAGYLRVITEGRLGAAPGDPHSRAADLVLRAHPEAVVTPIAPGDGTAMLAAGRVQAWAIGPGLAPGPPVRDLLATLLGADEPVVVDAGALDPLGELLGADPAVLRGRSAPVLVTPHEGEFARLTRLALGWDPRTTDTELARDRLGTVRRAAAATGATVLLKGARTLVVDPAGAAWANLTGSAWLGSAGTGDVLTGLIGSLLAAGVPATLAGAVGAHLHGRAAERAALPLAASDLPDLLPRVVTELLDGETAPKPGHCR